MLDIDDTIVAIASPTSPSLRGVIRLSGNDVLSILHQLGLDSTGISTATALPLCLDTSAPIGPIDLRVLVWPSSRSYTGQPSAEFHTYGSLPILQAVVDAVLVAGARAARPGEFTMRAFLAGRLDLTQAEAVLGVIDAQHRGALDHALRQLAGNLSQPLEQMRSTMLDLLADVEAGLDFVDEDIEFISDDVLVQRLSEIVDQLRTTQQTMLTRRGTPSKPVIALRGEPNAGKSQLLNRLVGSDVAIVADVAGTTRDVVTIDANLDGVVVQFVDTAGIEVVVGDGNDAFIANRAQQHAGRASDDASIRVWCVDTSRMDLQQASQTLIDAAQPRRQSVVDLWVGTKVDLGVASSLDPRWILTSSVTGQGIDALKKAISDTIASFDAEEIGSVVGTAARCHDTMGKAIHAICRAMELTSAQQGHEFVSAELRLAVQCLGEVTGAVYTDDILDRVFGRFCIGK
ncbi:MAG: tRNA uridine-5-carboxymethylaminomethyl(34) synthesis GTPase MnmE [Pirellulaceae bacterium]|nr:tRNA uridine-5-carboxymethylaminomethyl(34) synthesis GTPase MnmE [Pirellulaceae bacterium]